MANNISIQTHTNFYRGSVAKKIVTGVLKLENGKLTFTDRENKENISLTAEEIKAVSLSWARGNYLTVKTTQKGNENLKFPFLGWANSRIFKISEEERAKDVNSYSKWIEAFRASGIKAKNHYVIMLVFLIIMIILILGLTIGLTSQSK